MLGEIDVAEVEVPSVVGDTLEVARQRIAAAGLTVEEPVTREHQKDIPKDQVYEQTKLNMRVKEGSSIKLTVSNGPELVMLENYVGKSLPSVIDELGALGIKEEQIEIVTVFDEQEKDTILKQTPNAGEEFDPETVQFTFTVSQGQETFPMPDLIGKSLDVAQDLIRAFDLKLNKKDILYAPSYLHPEGHIIKQDPYEPDEQVEKGAPISIIVSSGPPADAKEHVFNIIISPAQAGKKSEVVIKYSDARGEDIVWGKRQIDRETTIPVTVVLSPDTEASVTVTRDKQYIDTKTITYDELINGSNSSNLTIPGEGVPPTEQPVQGEVNETTDEPDKEQQQEQQQQEQQPQ